MKKIILILTVIIIIFFPGEILAQSTELKFSKDIEIINSRLEGIEKLLKENKIDVSYLNMLERSNQTLSARWTPINIILVSLTTFFTLLILFIMLLASLEWKNIRKLREITKKTEIEKNKIISQAKDDFMGSKIEIDKLVKELNAKKKKIKSPQQLKAYEDKIESITDELEEKIKEAEKRVSDLNTYSTSSSSSITSSGLSSTITGGEIGNLHTRIGTLRTCKKCGNTYTEDGYMSTASFSDDSICGNCRKEK